MDSSLEAGGEDSAARPMELMGMALGACTAMDVISILRKKKQDVTEFDIQLHFDKAQEHPKVFTRGVITYELRGYAIEEAAVMRAIELSASKYCPAYAMLSKVFPIELHYRIYDATGNLVSEGQLEPVFA
jgi:putative redox protein